MELATRFPNLLEEYKKKLLINPVSGGTHGIEDWLHRVDKTQPLGFGKDPQAPEDFQALFPGTLPATPFINEQLCPEFLRQNDCFPLAKMER